METLADRIGRLNSHRQSLLDACLSVHATELCVLAIDPLTGGLTACDHVRPGESTPQQRRSAVSAFREIVGECVGQGRDGVIMVGPGNVSRATMVCLVVLARHGPTPIGAAAFIAPFADEQAGGGLYDRGVPHLASFRREP